MLWIGNVLIPAGDFRFVVRWPADEAWVRFQALGKNTWRVTARAWDDAGRPFLSVPSVFSVEHDRESSGQALLALTPLAPRQVRNAQVRPTEEGDFLLEARVFNKERALAFDIRPDRVIVPFGMALEQYGPNHPVPEGLP